MREKILVFTLVTLLCPALAGALTTQGVLPGDETWSGTVTIIGDVTVPSGVTLTIAPGATILFATTDSMGSGLDTSRTELAVKGTLKATGTKTSPIKLTRSGTSGNWYGVWVDWGANATLEHVTIDYPREGLRCYLGTLTFKSGTVSNAALYGAYIFGTAEISYSLFQSNLYGLYITGGTSNIHHNVILSSTYSALVFYGGTMVTFTASYNEIRGSCTTPYKDGVYLGSGSTVTFDHNTVAYNPGCDRALYIEPSAIVTVTNNIIASNGDYGAYTDSPYQTVSYNLIWGHSVADTYCVTSNSGVKANPLFVSQTDLHLQAASPARKAAADGSDLGCYPYQLVTGMSCTAGSECLSGHCVDGVCCNELCGNGDKTDCMVCSVSAGAAKDGTCTPLTKGTTCRAAAGPCDEPETCDGVATACPADACKSSTYVCRSAAGTCDEAETCDGKTTSCPADAFKPSSAICRAAAGECDLAESCSGSSPDCLVDVFKTPGTPCQGGQGSCSTAGICVAKNDAGSPDTMVADSRQEGAPPPPDKAVMTDSRRDARPADRTVGADASRRDMTDDALPASGERQDVDCDCLIGEQPTGSGLTLLALLLLAALAVRRRRS